MNNAVDVLYTHCIIHTEALGTEEIAPEVNRVLQEAVTVLNFIRSRPVSSRLFSKLCKAVGSDRDKLLYAGVRRLARGRELRRLVQLREEVK
jgi:hypothetical protein